MTAIQHWPGRHTDRHGSEDIVLRSDGRDSIRTTIRGVAFEGDSMDGLRAPGGPPPGQMYSFLHGALCSCLLEWEVPMPVEVDGQGARTGVLHCALRLGNPVGHGLDEQGLITTLRLDGRAYRNPQQQDDFEQALHDIQCRLPRGTRLKACIACVWSDYSPAGVALMAGLACFRGAKDLYRRCDGKHGPHGIFALWQERTEFVQETWLCEEFEHRISGRGYRGPFPYQGPAEVT